MKESRHLLLPLATLFTLVIGFSGCITQAIVKVEPSEVKIGETLTVSYIFRNYELVGELNVAKITVNVYHNGIHTDSYTLNHTSPGWKTSYVSLFQEAEIYSSTHLLKRLRVLETGSFESPFTRNVSSGSMANGFGYLTETSRVKVDSLFFLNPHGALRHHLPFSLQRLTLEQITFGV